MLWTANGSTDTISDGIRLENSDEKYEGFTVGISDGEILGFIDNKMLGVADSSKLGK